MDISQAADNAADCLESRGHCKEWLKEPGTGKVCMLGAMIYGNPSLGQIHIIAMNVNGYVHPLSKAVSEYIGTDHISQWNDEPERTTEEVIQVLRDVAIKYRKDEASGTLS